MSCNSVVVWGVSPLHWPWKQEKEWQEDVYDIIRHPATLLYTYTTHCCIENCWVFLHLLRCLKFASRLAAAVTGLATSFLVWKLSVLWPWPWADLVTSTLPLIRCYHQTGDRMWPPTTGIFLAYLLSFLPQLQSRKWQWSIEGIDDSQ